MDFFLGGLYIERGLPAIMEDRTRKKHIEEMNELGKWFAKKKVEDASNGSKT